MITRLALRVYDRLTHVCPVVEVRLETPLGAARPQVAAWLEQRANAYELDAACRTTYPGVSKSTLNPEQRRAIAHELRQIAIDLGLEASVPA